MSLVIVGAKRRISPYRARMLNGRKSQIDFCVLHDGTYTEGVTHSLDVAENWVAELPRDYNSSPYSQQEWRSWSRFTPLEDLTSES